MMLSMVDFPDPDGPTIATSSPRPITRFVSASATTSPYRWDTPVNSTT